MNSNTKINNEDESTSTQKLSIPNLDEKYITTMGPHYWHIIHFEAFKITINEVYVHPEYDMYTKRIEFMQMLNYIIKNMMCSCKNHAYQMIMINTHKFYKYTFQYTVDLHNQVNMRLNKQIMSYADALRQYANFLVVRR